MFLVKCKNDSGDPTDTEITLTPVKNIHAAMEIVDKDMDFDQAKEDMIEYGPGFIASSVEWDGRNTVMIASDGDTTFAYLVK